MSRDHYAISPVRSVWRERLYDWALAIALGVALAGATTSWWTS